MATAATELCVRCGKVTACSITPISGGRRFACSVCGESQGVDLDDDDHVTYERLPNGRVTYIGANGEGLTATSPPKRERPILFSGTMVRAILDGRKSMTRRVVKLPKGMQWYADLGGEEAGWYCDSTFGGGWWHISEMTGPYEVGMRLWVRETWQPARNGDTGEVIAVYAADWKANGSPEGRAGGKWKPSIHMPRWGSRITLEITDVRVERLQQITEADAIAEGCVRPVIGCALDNFYRLWETINGKGSWEASPWVWAVSFRRLEVAGA